MGTFLRSFRWGHVRQLDRVSRELLARAWAAGAGPGDLPLTIDLDSTICETYGLAKEGAPSSWLHWPAGLSPAAGHRRRNRRRADGRLREGRSNTARGRRPLPAETVGRVRHAGAKGQLTMRADSGFYTHGVVSVCRKTKVRSPSPSASVPDCATSLKPYPRRTGRPYLLDGGRRRRGRG